MRVRCNARDAHLRQNMALTMQQQQQTMMIEQQAAAMQAQAAQYKMQVSPYAGWGQRSVRASVVEALCDTPLQEHVSILSLRL